MDDPEQDGKRCQILSKNEKTSIYHQGLIKMLVIHEIRKRGFSWKTVITQHLSPENELVEES